VEASDGVGGRVRTDAVDGFLLDRGFQVILEAYPELRRRVDLKALDLKAFYPGALVRIGNEVHRMADPGLEMADALRSITAPVGSFADKLRVARLRQEVMGGDPERLLEAPAGTTEEVLREAGFSEGMIDRFFRPFFGGVLLDPTLGVSGRLFRYYFRMFAEGTSSLPATGMEALPRQLAARLPEGTLQLNHRVRRVTASRVEFEGGGSLEAEAVVVAVEGPEAARLLGDHVVDPGSRSVTCLYFDAPESPVDEEILVLNGDGPSDGPVNNLAVLSDVARGYAPSPGGRLVHALELVPLHPAGLVPVPLVGEPQVLRDAPVGGLGRQEHAGDAGAGVGARPHQVEPLHVLAPVVGPEVRRLHELGDDGEGVPVQGVELVAEVGGVHDVEHLQVLPQPSIPHSSRKSMTLSAKG
jgi:hypothetical protein